MRLIDADALNGYKFGLISSYAQNLFHKTINEAPTIVQEQRTGRWIKHFDDLFPAESYIECSVCGDCEPLEISDNFCPNCGAKMEVVDENG